MLQILVHIVVYQHGNGKLLSLLEHQVKDQLMILMIALAQRKRSLVLVGLNPMQLFLSLH